MAGTFYIRRREGGIQDFQHSIIFDPSLPHAKAEAHAVAGWLHAHVTNGATTARQKLLKSMKGSRFVHIVGRSTYAKDPRAPGDQGRKEGSDYQKEVCLLLSLIVVYPQQTRAYGHRCSTGNAT